MTQFVLHTGIDLHGLQFITPFQFGSYSNETSTSFDVTDGIVGAVTDHISGTGFFYYTPGGPPTEGTITDIENSFQGKLDISITGLDLSAAALIHHFDEHSRGKLIKDFFGGDDQVRGSAENDKLFGYGGNDVLSGHAGDDFVVGGAGQDTLSGGQGSDRFIFDRLTDSTNTAPDLITDLTNQDKIDLHHIDPNLQLVAAFDGHADELVLSYDKADRQTVLQVDVDGDGQADMTVLISGNHTDFSHFVL